MKVKLYITGLIVLLASKIAFACDVCGCSQGGSYFGILPQFQQTFTGVRYQNRSFNSEHLTLSPGEVPLSTIETFHTSELWGRYVLKPKIHLFAFFPYNIYTKEEEGLNSTVSGIGDISIMAHYILFNSGSALKSNLKQALQIGIGLKFPTGKSDNLNKNGLLIPSLQAGTGSLDIPLSVIYTLRKDKWGINTEANYRLNFANKRNYKFGDRVNTSLKGFYWHGNKTFTLLPQIGIGYEYGFQDFKKNNKEEYTGSQVFWGGMGFDFYMKNLTITANYQIPLQQNIAKGQITSN